MRNYMLDFYWLIRSSVFDGLCFVRDFIVEYGDLRFAKADRFLRNWAKLHSHRKEYGKFLGSAQRQLQEPYGETPIKTMRTLVRAMGIEPYQTVLELGSGRGRVAMWLATQVGCKVIGVEHAPFMIELARLASKEAGISSDEILWIESDFVKAPFEKADIVYFYGTGLPDKVYEKLCLRLKNMDRPPHIITIGGPLSEYDACFSVIQMAPVVYSWGWTTAYLNVCNRP